MNGIDRRPALAMKALVLGVAALAGSAARADEADARRIFRAMSDYLGTQKSLSFDFDSSLEVVSTDRQKLALVSSGTLTLARPDRLYVARTGGFEHVEMVFDGKTLTLLGKHSNKYAQIDGPATVDEMVEVLRKKYGRSVPAADLLIANPFKELLSEITNVKDLGSGVIHGVECDHLAFRTKEVDWQIWIAQGDRPYPCRYVITSKKVTGWPQYTVDIRGWKSGTEVAAEGFKAKIPENATKLKPEAVPELGDIPTLFSAAKGAKK